MARLFLFLIVLAGCVLFALVLRGIWTALVQTSTQGMRRATATIEGQDMGSTGIQKAAYVALIVVLFGVASGWLGGL